MPDLGLTRTEVAELVAYLDSLRVADGHRRHTSRPSAYVDRLDRLWAERPGCSAG